MKGKNIVAYRIEHPPCGEGIWNANKPGEPDTRLYHSFSFRGDLVYIHQKFPCPQEERELCFTFNPSYFCAYPNKKAFEDWFEKDWFPEIINAGFKIYELTLSEAYYSDNQVIFKKENITLKKDITNEFN